MLGPVGAQRLFLGFAAVSFLVSLALELTGAASPGQRIGFLLAAVILGGVGWWVGRFPDERGQASVARGAGQLPRVPPGAPAKARSAFVGPIGAKRIILALAGACMLTALVSDLADALRPLQHLVLLGGALVLGCLGWWVGRVPGERRRS